MHPKRIGIRAEHRQREGQRINASASLANQYQALKSLTVDLAYYGSERLKRSSHIKYDVNLNHAKSVFSFNCQNDECIRGDFDLSRELAEAVAVQRTVATGEKCCQGWRNKTTIDTQHCHNILRYTLTLKY